MFNNVAKQQIVIIKHKARGSWMTMKKRIFCTKATNLKILKAKDQLQASQPRHDSPFSYF